MSSNNYPTYYRNTIENALRFAYRISGAAINPTFQSTTQTPCGPTYIQTKKNFANVHLSPPTIHPPVLYAPTHIWSAEQHSNGRRTDDAKKLAT